MTKSFKKFIILWLGQLIASIGHGLTTFALGVFAFSISKQAMASSLVMVFGFLPTVLLTVPAGILADKYDRRFLMILGDGLSALGLLVILIAKISGKINLGIILLGVAISAVFSALMQPAFMATISDLLPKEEYTKATGMTQIVGSAQYLISPLLAGFLMEAYGLEMILIVDILTVVITVIVTGYVRKGLETKEYAGESAFEDDLKEGWLVLKDKQGIFVLVIIATLLTFFMGFIQNLSSPYFLSFSDSKTLGQSMSISALGMLVSGILVGVFSIKEGFIKKLVLALFMAGIFMIGFAATENFYIITISGFLFFASLPVINSCLDYLVRINIENKFQGRVFAFIGLISQMGFVVSYILSGVLADGFFTPALMENGLLANSFGEFIGTGPSRGIALEIMLAGVLMSLSTFLIITKKEVTSLEKTGAKYEQ